MMTRFLALSERTRATSLSIVVLPTPGLPSNSTLRPDVIRSSMTRIVPKTARPTLNVIPTISPDRFFIADILCNVRSMPALLSELNAPTFSMDRFKSSFVISSTLMISV